MDDLMKTLREEAARIVDAELGGEMSVGAALRLDAEDIANGADEGACFDAVYGLLVQLVAEEREGRIEDAADRAGEPS